jgi:hypothetical protein
MSRKFYLAGVQFRPTTAIAAIQNLQEGDELILDPEPDNKYDPNAIRVMVDSEVGDEATREHLGYVPKKFSAEIAAMIEVDGLDTVQCIVTKVDPDAKKWEMCEVEVVSVDEDQEGLEEELEPGWDGDVED